MYVCVLPPSIHCSCTHFPSHDRESAQRCTERGGNIRTLSVVRLEWAMYKDFRPALYIYDWVCWAPCRLKSLGESGLSVLAAYLSYTHTTARSSHILCWLDQEAKWSEEGKSLSITYGTNSGFRFSRRPATNFCAANNYHRRKTKEREKIRKCMICFSAVVFYFFTEKGEENVKTYISSCR